MSVIGIGVDVIECSRIQHSIERFGDRFLHRVFTEGEIEYSMSMKFPERHLAARFAGKEAASKAFGTGIGRTMGWRNIDIRKKESGEPFLRKLRSRLCRSGRIVPHTGARLQPRPGRPFICRCLQFRAGTGHRLVATVSV